MRTTGIAGLLRPLMIVFAVLAFAPQALAYDSYEGPTGLGNAHISYLEGDVLFNSPDTDGWAAVAPNFTLRDGDRLWAGEDSRLEVIFRGGPYAWVNDKSGLDVLMMDIGQGGSGDTYHVSLPFGEASFSVGNFHELGSVFQVDTPNASIRAYGSARFRAIALSDGSTQVGVSDGSVEVETADGIVTARDGDLLEVTRRGKVQFADLPRADSWDRWVDTRVDRYSRNYDSDRYLPEDMHDYSYELDGGGRWVSYPEYGFVWVPAVDPSWSPYSNGRWVWVGDNYIWLSYDPWYAPFHFGRWAWTASFGWYWVPPVSRSTYWSPGYVGWSYSAADVYWVPLAPGELYYGYGDYGRNSVNIAGVRSVGVINVYVNSRVSLGVVGTHRDDFLGGRVKRVRLGERDNPFTHRDRRTYTLIGRPPVKEIKPVVSTKRPKPESKITERMRPPDWVGKNADVIRKDRSVARKADESAFKGVEKTRRIENANTKRTRTERAAPVEKRKAVIAPESRQRDESGGSGGVRTPDRGRDRQRTREPEPAPRILEQAPVVKKPAVVTPPPAEQPRVKEPKAERPRVEKPGNAEPRTKQQDRGRDRQRARDQAPATQEPVVVTPEPVKVTPNILQRRTSIPAAIKETARKRVRENAEENAAEDAAEADIAAPDAENTGNKETDKKKDGRAR